MKEIYDASCINLRELQSQQRHLKKMFNFAVLYNKHYDVSALTILYALFYSAFAEVAFLKLIHTPYGFSEDCIEQIQKPKNLEAKWEKCIELALSRIRKKHNLGDISNKRQTLGRILKKYIIEPSQMRNKVAHGQWKIALNSSNTGANPEMTSRLETLDFVQIDVLFEIYSKFSQSIEDLIESPHKAHYRDYYSIITELESYISEREHWTYDSRCERIRNTKKRKF